MKTFTNEATMRINEDIKNGIPETEAVIAEIVRSLCLALDAKASPIIVREKITDHCEKTGKNPAEHEWSLSGDFLYVDGEKLCRVVPAFEGFDFTPNKEARKWTK